MANEATKEKWQGFVNVTSKAIANHPGTNFLQTVAMYLGDPCHKNFQLYTRSALQLAEPGGLDKVEAQAKYLLDLWKTWKHQQNQDNEKKVETLIEEFIDILKPNNFTAEVISDIKEWQRSFKEQTSTTQNQEKADIAQLKDEWTMIPSRLFACLNGPKRTEDLELEDIQAILDMVEQGTPNSTVENQLSPDYVGAMLREGGQKVKKYHKDSVFENDNLAGFILYKVTVKDEDLQLDVIAICSVVGGKKITYLWTQLPNADQRRRQEGCGTVMIKDVTEYAMRLAQTRGLRSAKLVLDALPNVYGFYLKLGFQILSDQESLKINERTECIRMEKMAYLRG